MCVHMRTLQGQTVPPGDASPSSLLSVLSLFLHFFYYHFPPHTSISSPRSCTSSLLHSCFHTLRSLSHERLSSSCGQLARRGGWIKGSVWEGEWGEVEGERVIWLKKTHLQPQQNENTVSLILHSRPCSFFFSPFSDFHLTFFSTFSPHPAPPPPVSPMPGVCTCVQVWVSSKHIEGKAKQITLKLALVEIYCISGVQNCTPAWDVGMHAHKKHAPTSTRKKKRKWNKSRRPKWYLRVCAISIIVI